MSITANTDLSSFLLQILVLLTGIALILTAVYLNKGPAVLASGVFFVNIFWVTMVLSHDIKIWSFLRYTVAGGVFMISVIVLNLIAVFYLAVFR